MILSREIECWNDRIALKFDMCLGTWQILEQFINSKCLTPSFDILEYPQVCCHWRLELSEVWWLIYASGTCTNIGINNGLVACHYLNQCCHCVSWALTHFAWIYNTSTQGIKLWNVVLKMEVIFSRPQHANCWCTYSIHSLTLQFCDSSIICLLYHQALQDEMSFLFYCTLFFFSAKCY